MMWLVNMPVIVIPKSSLTKEEIENKVLKGKLEVLPKKQSPKSGG